MEGGNMPMSWVLGAKTNQGVILSLIHTIQVGKIIQISSGGSPNKPNNRVHLGSNLRDSTKGHMHPHNPKHNLPKPNQVRP
ncbi:hypothetical protein C1H46_014422 [Malus baccata]|uniref:Uncharacterized protein n=1 Tax=Malus baccata TaxID=106549 RepID=A0A540MMB1_MALBA|nr:hypothetical protein C1H46_014422 [Malus baccata]